MEYRQFIEDMPVETYEQLRRAVELGKWPDGNRLTAEQRENAMQAIIAWGRLHLPESERVGFIDAGSKAGQDCDDPQVATLKWKDGEEAR